MMLPSPCSFRSIDLRGLADPSDQQFTIAYEQPPAKTLNQHAPNRLATNLKSAKTLRLAVPPTLLARVDEVIEVAGSCRSFGAKLT
jgi:hypothetical protein